MRKRDAERWQHFLRGLWLTGLRLGEALALSWDKDAALCMDLSGRRPRLRIHGSAQKSGKTETVPLLPDAAEFFLATPEAEREGLVLDLAGSGFPMSDKRVSRTVSAIGREARIVTDKAEGRFATAHDLRRSFGTRWAKRVLPQKLQRLMRHANIQTTLSFYVDLDSDDLADELWEQFGSEFNKPFNSDDCNARLTEESQSGEVA